MNAIPRFPFQTLRWPFISDYITLALFLLSRKKGVRYFAKCYWNNININLVFLSFKMRWNDAGHNFFSDWPRRTGKSTREPINGSWSTVVREIISNLQAAGKNVSVACSTGIACTLYDASVACTEYSYYEFASRSILPHLFPVDTFSAKIIQA